MSATGTPRVWIGCLASYNAGRSIGEWVDAVDVDEMYEAQKRVAAAAIKAAIAEGEYPVYFGEPEEFAIHDYDNFPSAVVCSLGDYARYERVATIGRLIKEKGELFVAWLRFVDNLGDVDTDDLESRCEEQCVQAGVDSEEDYARDHVSSCGLGEIEPGEHEVWTPWGKKMINYIESIENYIDWEAVVRELFAHGTLTLVRGYVFDSEL